MAEPSGAPAGGVEPGEDSVETISISSISTQTVEKTADVPPNSELWAKLATPFAYVVFGLVGIVVVAPFVLLTIHEAPAPPQPLPGASATDPTFAALREWNKDQLAAIIDWAKTILAPIVGFGSAVVGYFFGARGGGRSERSR